MTKGNVVAPRDLIFHIEPGRPEHVPLIFAFMRELADYEKLLHEVVPGLVPFRTLKVRGKGADS
jgi:hypothetical protein